MAISRKAKTILKDLFGLNRPNEGKTRPAEREAKYQIITKSLPLDNDLGDLVAHYSALGVGEIHYREVKAAGDPC